MTQKKLAFLVPAGYVEKLFCFFGQILTNLVCFLSGCDFENLGLGLDDLREENCHFCFSAEMKPDGSFLVTFNIIDSVEGNGEKFLVEEMSGFEAELYPQI